MEGSSSASRIVAALRPHCKPKRLARLEAVLNQRTWSVQLAFENVASASTALSVADQFGVGIAHLIERYAHTELEGRGCRAAARWLDLRRYQDTWQFLEKASALSSHVLSIVEEGSPKHNLLLEEGDSENIVPLERFDIMAFTQPCIFVFGNTDRGVSPLMSLNSLRHIVVENRGMTRGISVGVLGALLLAHVAATTHHFAGEEREDAYFSL
jgi:hypothetical protein